MNDLCARVGGGGLCFREGNKMSNNKKSVVQKHRLLALIVAKYTEQLAELCVCNC